MTMEMDGTMRVETPSEDLLRWCQAGCDLVCSEIMHSLGTKGKESRWQASNTG